MTDKKNEENLNPLANQRIAELNTANEKLCKEIKDLTTSRNQLQERLHLENLINSIFSRFINIPIERLNDEIQSAQQEICETIGVDLCTLWQFIPEQPSRFILSSFYQSPEFKFDRPKSFEAKEYFPWALEKMQKKEIVILSSLADAPAEAARDIEACLQLGYKSCLVYPLYVTDSLSFGALGFSTLKAERVWSEEIIALLKIFSQLFSNLLKRKFTEKNLRDSEMRIKLAMDSADAGLWSWDYSTGVIWATEKARSLYGFLPDEEISADKFFNVLHPDDLVRIRLLSEQIFQDKKTLPSEYRIVLPDKSIRWISARAQGFLKPCGKPDKMMGASVDITQRMKNETELSELRVELTHLARVLTMNELSTSLAHEINQPLGAILNNASAAKELLCHKKDCCQEIPEILQDIIQDSKRAGDVIRKIRGVIKKEDINLEILNMNDLIEEVMELLQNTIRINQIALQLDLQHDLTKVKGERVHLQQVLLNLITNALDALQETDTRTLTIRSRMTAPDIVTVCISDSGQGIDEKIKDKLFSAFFTTKKKGLGVGLSICKLIIEEHDGQIWAENNQKSGATFSFSLKVEGVESL